MQTRVRQFLDAHFHPAGLRMAGDIGQRFLGDAIEHRALGAVQLLHRRKGRQAARGCPSRFVKLFMNECRAGISPRSSSTVGRSSRANRCTMSTDFSTSRCVRAMFLLEALGVDRGLRFQGRQPDIDARQGLGDDIMQFAADLLALFLLRRQKLAGQMPQLFLQVPRLLQQLGCSAARFSGGTPPPPCAGRFPASTAGWRRPDPRCAGSASGSVDSSGRWPPARCDAFSRSG